MQPNNLVAERASRLSTVSSSGLSSTVVSRTSVHGMSVRRIRMQQAARMLFVVAASLVLAGCLTGQSMSRGDQAGMRMVEITPESMHNKAIQSWK